MKYHLILLLILIKNIKSVIKLYIFLAKHIVDAKNILFFSGYNSGGAEKVHSDIVKNLHKKTTIVFFVHQSQDDKYLKDFNSNSNTFQLPDLDINRALKNLYLLILSKRINGLNKKVNLFGCKNVFFYELIKKVNNCNIQKIDLLHAFAWPDPGIENISIKFVEYLNKRIVINNKTKEDYIRQYQEHNIPNDYIKRIIVIENGIKTEKNLPVKKDKKRLTILFCGRLSEEKRPHIFAEISKKIPDADFAIAGSTPVPEKLYQTIKFLGNLDSSSLNTVYDNTDILLLTSYREGFPLVIMEAMAKGVVCISTDVGSIPDHITDGVNGFLVSNNMDEKSIINDFVKTIKLLERDRNTLKEISNNAYLYAKTNFDIATFNAKYKELLLDEK